MVEPLSINPTPQDNPVAPLSIDMGDVIPTLSPDTADKRVKKISFGNPDLDPNKVSTAVYTGNEQQLREELASNKNYKDIVKRGQAIQDFARAKGGPLHAEDLENLKNFINTPGVSPDNVVEQGFSKQYLDMLRNTPGLPGSWFDDAQQQIPEQVEQIHKENSAYLTKIEIARTQRENSEALEQNQSWPSWLGDQSKYLVPFYIDYKVRGQIETVSKFYGLLGDNLEEQAKNLLRLPIPEYTDKFKAIMTQLNKDNPSAAVTFAHAVEGQSLDERFLNNTFNIIDATTLKGLGLGALGMAVARKAVFWNDTRQLYKQAIKASEALEHEAVNVVVPAAAGDMQTAAVNKVTNSVVASIKGIGANPIKDSLEGLQGALKADETRLATNPGNLAVEFTNRLVEQAATFRNNFMNAISNISRVERIPAVAAAKDAFQAIVEDFKYEYRGPANTILNVWIRYNPVLNTRAAEFALGRHSGEIFSRIEEARNFLKNYGISLKGELTPAQVSYKNQLEELIGNVSKDLDRLREQRRVASLNPKLGVKPNEGVQSWASEFGQVEKLTELERTVTPSSFKKEKELSTQIKTLEDSVASAHTELTSLRGTETGAVIVPHGRGYWISMTKPLDETKTVIRDAALKLEQSVTPDGWFNAFFGWLRSPEETLSTFQNQNRKVAAYANSVLLKVAKEEAKSIRALARWTFPGTPKKERFLQWEKAVKFSREEVGPDGKKGYFKQTVGELDEFFRQNFQRGVTEAETSAYFSFVRLVEMDRTLRNMALYRNMSRVGSEMHMLTSLNEQGEKIESQWFAGKRHKDLPGGDGSIAFIGKMEGQESATSLADMSSTARTKLKDQLLKGEVTIIEPYDPELRPLQGFGKIGDERIRYIVTANNSQVRPLAFDNIPRRGGGHFDFDYDHYIKQANMRFDKASKKFWYEGDKTLMPIANRAMGEDIAKVMEEVRVAMKAKDFGAAEEAAKKLGMPWEEVKTWFSPKRDAVSGKINPARFSLEEPFQVVKRNSMIVDKDDSLKKRYMRTDKSGRQVDMFQDGTRQGSLARQFQIEYTGDRDSWDMFSLRNEGTAQDPIYKYEPAKLIDPIPSLNRGLSRIINSTFMDDYKIFSVEHWLQEASKWLKEDWKSAPFYFFNRANEYYVPGIPADVKSRLELSRYQIQQFTGIASKTQALLDSLAQHIADSIYKKTGKSEGILLTPANMVAHLTDPLKFAHFITYNAVIGLWSVPQLVVQSMSFVTIAGISGMSKAGPGMAATFMHQISRMNKNPEIIKWMDKTLSSITILGMSRWRPGEFIEAMNELKKTGFENVGGEHSLADHAYAPKVIQNGAANFLDAGTMIFKGAERNVRYGAWYTAYREFRDLHPTGAISNIDRDAILNRADLLTGNMSRASKSMLQTGILSFPSQFLSYQLRLAEQITGKRLTSLEKARLLGTYTAAFGLPVAMGAAGLPLTDMMRQSALEGGYVVGDNWIEHLVTEGLPATVGRLITGQTYDVGQRLGGPGMDIIREGLSGDKPWWTILGGATGTLLQGAFQATDGFRKAMMSHMQDKSDIFPLTLNNFVDPLKQISSVNNTFKLLGALGAGKWYSRNESLLADNITTEGAFLRYITGMQTQQEADLTRVTWTLKDRKALQDYAEKEFIRYMRRGLLSLDNNDREQAKAELTQAKVYLILSDYPKEKYDQAYSLAFKDKETLVNRINWDFNYKNVPESQKDIMLDARKRQLNLTGQ